MSVRLSSVHQTAPITALAVLPASPPVLLAGTASTVLSLRLAPAPGKTEQWRALERDRVHSIVAVEEEDVQGQGRRWKILVVGGREAALLRAELDADEQLTIERLWLISTPDWVHSSAFISTTSIGFITAHNSILHYVLDPSSPSAAPELVHTYHCPLRPLLWTASFSRSSYSRVDEVVAGAGAMIGDALCFSLASIDRRTSSTTETILPMSSVICLRGHYGDTSTEYRNFMGAAFCLVWSADGIRVLTGSDDRTVRVWDIPQLPEEGDRQEDGSRVIGPSRTLWGHEGRVWRLSWLDPDTIASVAEDTTCRVWSLRKTDEAKPIVKAFKEGHDGRSIWALASCRVGEVQLLVSGGADGGIRSWALDERPLQREELDKERGRFLALDVGSSIGSFFAAELQGEGQVGLVVTKLGLLYSTPLPPAPSNPPKLLFQSAALRAPCLLNVTRNRILLFSNLGLILTMDRATGEARHAETGIAAAAWGFSSDGRRVALYERRGARVVVLDLSDFLDGTEKPRVVGQLALEQKMLLRSLKFSPDGGMLLLGSQAGAVLLCSTAELTILARLDTAHTATVNQFAFIASDDQSCLWDVESVSRDGTVAVHRIERLEGSYTLRTLRHQSISRGDVSQILTPLLQVGTKRYLSLVETTAVVVDADGSALNEFISPGRYDPLVVCSARGVDLYRTMSGKVHHQFAQAKRPAPPGVLRPRFHGREVRSIALDKFETETQSVELIITGAENAVLRVSRIEKDRSLTALWEDPQPIAAVKAVAVSSHDQAGPHFLFASGACEHLRAFKMELNEAALSGTNESEIRARVLPAGSGPTVTLSGGEVRVMDMWVGPLDLDGRTHWGATGYSDGFVRLWTYDERRAKFAHVAESGRHAKCLLSLKMVKIPGVGEAGWLLFSAATDGLVGVWDLTALRKRLVKDPTAALELEDPILTYRAHLSGVNGLDVVWDPRELAVLLATAGDDNSLALARVHLASGIRVEPLSRVPCAHSSTIQGLEFLSPTTLVSSCVDQRLNVWNLFTDRPDGVKVKDRAVMSLVGAKELAVADCSAMSCSKTSGESEWLVGVAGIGVELLEVDVGAA